MTKKEEQKTKTAIKRLAMAQALVHAAAKIVYFPVEFGRISTAIREATKKLEKTAEDT